MSNKYTCPLCGASYSNAEELAACVAKDAKKIKEKEDKIKENATKKVELEKFIGNKKKEIDELAAKLQLKINEYNTAGKQLADFSPNSAAHCTFSISYSEKNSEIDMKDILNYYKSNKNNSIEKLYHKSLDELIDTILNF